jgi:hypothetical protein
LPDLVNQLLRKLSTNDVIGGKRLDLCPAPPYGHFNQLVDKLRRVLNYGWWGVVCLLISVAYVVLYRLPHAPIWSKDPSGRERFWGTLAYGTEALTFYWGALSIIRITVISLFVSKLARFFEFDVKPLHPDGCGGFQEIGHLFTRLVQLAALIGLTVVGMFIALRGTGNNPAYRVEWWVLGLVYVLLLPMVVIAFLLVPHQAMIRARSRIVEPVAKRFATSVLKARPVEEDTAHQITNKTERLSQIVVQVKILNEAYPIWPIQIRLLQQAAATALLPILVSGVSAIVIRLVSGNSA